MMEQKIGCATLRLQSDSSDQTRVPKHVMSSADTGQGRKYSENALHLFVWKRDSATNQTMLRRSIKQLC